MTQPEIDLYLRKSKVIRDGEFILSLDAQEQRGREWAQDNGFRVRKVWHDNLSAWSDVERPGFDSALSAVMAEQVPALWCAYLDRLPGRVSRTSFRSWAKPV